MHSIGASHIHPSLGVIVSFVRSLSFLSVSKPLTSIHANISVCFRILAKQHLLERSHIQHRYDSAGRQVRDMSNRLASYLGTIPACMIIAQVLSSNVLFVLSASLLDCDVCGEEVVNLTPFRANLFSIQQNSGALSLCKVFTLFRALRSNHTA